MSHDPSLNVRVSPCPRAATAPTRRPPAPHSEHRESWSRLCPSMSFSRETPPSPGRPARPRGTRSRNHPSFGHRSSPDHTSPSHRSFRDRALKWSDPFSRGCSKVCRPPPPPAPPPPRKRRVCFRARPAKHFAPLLSFRFCRRFALARVVSKGPSVGSLESSVLGLPVFHRVDRVLFCGHCRSICRFASARVVSKGPSVGSIKTPSATLTFSIGKIGL